MVRYMGRVWYRYRKLTIVATLSSFWFWIFIIAFGKRELLFLCNIESGRKIITTQIIFENYTLTITENILHVWELCVYTRLQKQVFGNWFFFLRYITLYNITYTSVCFLLLNKTNEKFVSLTASIKKQS